MKAQFRTTTLVKISIVMVLSLLFSRTALSQASENQQIVIEGSLTDATGNALDLTSVPLVFYVSTNTGCYLYGETTSSAGDNQGNILHRIGSATRLAGSPNNFSHSLFYGGVSGTTTAGGNPCAVTAADVRQVQVYYAAQNITATMNLGSVPYAHSATTLNGKTAADFLQPSNDSNTLFSGGTTGQVLTKSAAGGLSWQTPSVDLASSEVTGTLPALRLPSLTGDISSAVGSSTTTLQSIRGKPLSTADPTTGQILVFNGSQWAPTTVPTNIGTVTNISSTNSDIIVTSPSTTPSLTLNVGTGASQIIRLDATGKLPSVDASNLLNIDATNITTGTLSTNRLPSMGGDISNATGSGNITVTRIRNISVSSTVPAANQVLAYNGAEWGPKSLGALSTKDFVQLNSDVAGILPIDKGGSKWSLSGSNMFTVSNTAIGANTLPSNTKLYVESNTTTGQIAKFNNTNSNGNGVAIAVAGNSSLHYAMNITNSGGSIFKVQNDGLIGLGTLSPNARLHIVAGSTTVAPLKLTSGPILSAPASGSIEYDGSRFYLTDDLNTRRAIATVNANNSTDSITAINSATDLTLNVSNTVYVTGNLVVGTATPAARFNVITNTAGSELSRFDGGSSGFYNTYSTDGVLKAKEGISNGTGILFSPEISGAFGIRAEQAIQLGVGANAVLTIANNKNVGIGTSSPSSALTVSGSIRVISGGYEYADGTSQTTSAFGGYERINYTCSSVMNCTVTCSAGKKIIGGGCSLGSGINKLISSFPETDASWKCQSGSNDTIVAWAICTKM